MKIYFLALTLTGLAACVGRTEANRDSFTAAVNGYLDKRGDLCLGKYDWPIEVSAQEIQAGGRNASLALGPSRQAIDRGTAVPEHERRPEAAIFC